MKEIIAKAEQFVKIKFKEADLDLYTYHNWDHTARVIKAANQLAEHNDQIDEHNKNLIHLAAIFHDCAFSIDRFNHEELSANIASEFMQNEGMNNDDISIVKKLISATKMEAIPEGEQEKIIKDADLAHLSDESYIDNAFCNLKQELNNLEEKKIKKRQWVRNCKFFLKAHHYYTDFAKQKFDEGKAKNIKRLEIMEQELIEKKKKKKKKKPNKSDSPLKGVETMYKVALRNHVDLSSIADNKANTLISVNAIIISIVLSALFPKLDSNPFLFYPGLSILLFTIVTIILSILSTIPNVNNQGKVSREEVTKGLGNLTFFGNFHKMNLTDYEWSMNQLMNNKDYLYNTLSRDLFFLGKVLNKKYKLLRYAYYSFVIGLLASIIIFIVSIVKVLNAQ